MLSGSSAPCVCTIWSTAAFFDSPKSKGKWVSHRRSEIKWLDSPAILQVLCEISTFATTSTNIMSPHSGARVHKQSNTRNVVHHHNEQRQYWNRECEPGFKSLHKHTHQVRIWTIECNLLATCASLVGCVEKPFCIHNISHWMRNKCKLTQKQSLQQTYTWGLARWAQ